MIILFKERFVNSIDDENLYSLSELSSILKISYNNLDTILKFNSVKPDRVLGARTRLYKGSNIKTFIKNNYIISEEYLKSMNLININELLGLDVKKVNLYYDQDKKIFLKIYNNSKFSYIRESNKEKFKLNKKNVSLKVLSKKLNLNF